MTTIAFLNGVIAADSRSSDGDNDFHVTNTNKLYRLKSGAVLGCAGDDDIREVLKLLNRAKANKLPSRKQLAATKVDFGGILVFPNRKVYIINIGYKAATEDGGSDEWQAEVTEIEDENRMCAVGTGYGFAYGAMEAGCTSDEAVEIASRRDLRTYLPVQTIVVYTDINTNEPNQ